MGSSRATWSAEEKPGIFEDTRFLIFVLSIQVEMAEAFGGLIERGEDVVE